MSQGLWVAVLAAASIGLATPSFAQQPTRRVGMVMGYPATAGLLWHVTDRVALRPDVSITRQRTEITSTVSLGPGGGQTATSTSDGWTTSLGLSALFYIGAPDSLRFYVTPRLAWAWSRTDTESTPASVTTLGAYETESDGYLVAGAFGAQYAPHERFRLFGELGVSYSRQEGSSGFAVSRSEQTSTGVGLRSGVGVVVYF